jgi:MoxR-like ATPase
MKSISQIPAAGTLADEREMVERFQLRHPIDTLQPVATPDRVLRCQEAVRKVTVPPAVCDYILQIVRATREHPALRLGSSPRGSLGLFPRRAGEIAC